MITIMKYKTKAVLFLMIIALTATIFPMSNVYADGINDQIPPADTIAQRRFTLPRIWKFQQKQYEQLGRRLERTDLFITRMQERIDSANQNGKDTSAIQSALDVFKQANHDAQIIHQKGEGIISAHTGFDMDGKVIDRTLAVKSVESLSDVIRETRDARRDPIRLLRDALRSFREANRPASTSTNPAP